MRLGIVVLLCCASVVVGQSTFGVIRGHVLDSAGAAVSGAGVEITNTATNIRKSATSSETGLYEAGYLQPGVYSVTAAQPGFKRFTAVNLVLNANAVVLVDVRLELGEVSTSVKVEAGAPLITTEAAVISDVKTQKTYLQAPVNQRGNWDSYIFNYMSLVPGVQPTSAPYRISFAGTRYQDSEITVDGISLRRDNGGIVGPPVASMETLQEVRVGVSGNSAEFSTPSNVGVITRGGQNALHGSFLWYYTTGGFNARSPFASTKAFALLNDYGGNVSGPIRKNKTFFLGTFEGFNQRYSANVNTSVASARVRGGDFSRLLDTRGVPIVVRDPLNNQPFANAVVPTNRLNATALKIQERFFPLPNFGDPESVVSNYRDLIKQGRRREQVDIRVDHQLFPSNALFARVTVLRMPLHELEGLPSVGFRYQRRQNRNFVVSDTHTLRPNLINEFRAGMSRDFNPWGIALNGPQTLKELGLIPPPPPPELPDAPGVPKVSITGFRTITYLDTERPEYNIWQWQDNLSWMRGRHTIKAGVEISHYMTSRYSSSPSLAYGDMSFTGMFSNHAYGDFLLGIPRTASLARSTLDLDHRPSNMLSLFLQDDFKVTSRLTLNIGVRWEYKPPQTEDSYRISSFNPWLGRLVIPQEESRKLLNPSFLAANLVPVVTAQQAGIPTTMVFSDKNNIAPRLGFAYKLTSDNKTVVRGAYGIFYNTYISELGGGVYGGSLTSPPNAITNGAPAWQLPALFPAAAAPQGAANLAGVDPHVKIPYMQQFNFSLEREIWGMGLRASYMGMKTNKLVVSRNFNQLAPSRVPFNINRRPYPQLGTVTTLENGGSMFYNGLILSAERKLKNGFLFQVSHTWAKDLTDAHDAGSIPTLTNAYDRSMDRGNNVYTRNHRFVVTSIWDLPFRAGGRQVKTPVLRQLISDWSLSAFVIAQTGQYFTPSFSGSDPANIGATGGRPDRISSGVLSDPTIQRWFDINAFVPPPANAGRFGNSGINILRGPGTQLLNLGAFKRFTLRENLRVQVEATFTNALNHPNYSNPSSNVANATAGVIQGVQSNEGAGPRTGRIGLRLDF